MIMNKNKKAKIFFQQANRQGSVLAFTLIVMFIFLVIAIGIANVAVKEIKTSSDTGKSTMAFQVADSGMETVLEKIKGGPYTTVNELATVGGMVCVDDSGATPAVIGSTLASGGEYELTFKDDADPSNDILLCTSGATIGSIKSKGTYKQIARAVEAGL